MLQAIPIYLFLSLAAPKYVLKYIYNIQRKLLWKGTKYGRKWALDNPKSGVFMFGI
jgi:hypothetical protein